MSQKNLTIEDIKKAMTDPSVRNSKPEEMITKLQGLLGLTDLEPTDASATEEVRKTYFQAFTLDKDNWAPLTPGTFIQTVPFKLRRLPDGTRLIADVLIDKTDFEMECFDRYIRSMDVRGKTIIFNATLVLPVDITLGLKCVDAFGTPVELDPKLFYANK